MDDENETLLPKTAAFSGIDFIANKTLSLKVVAQGIMTKLAQASMLVIYECRNIMGVKKQSAHIFISNQTAHGWYSAIPALKQYYKRIQDDMRQAGHEFKTSIIYSDRGRSDIWCAPFTAYACELATEFGITMQPNTTASGEGKWMYDQIRGCSSQFIQHLRWVLLSSVLGTL